MTQPPEITGAGSAVTTPPGSPAQIAPQRGQVAIIESTEAAASVLINASLTS